MASELTNTLLGIFRDSKFSESEQLTQLKDIVNVSREMDARPVTKAMVVDLNYSDSCNFHNLEGVHTFLSMAMLEGRRTVIEELIHLGADVQNALFWAFTHKAFSMADLIYSTAGQVGSHLDVMKPFKSPEKSSTKSQDITLHEVALKYLTPALQTLVNEGTTDQSQLEQLNRLVGYAQSFANKSVNPSNMALDLNAMIPVEQHGGKKDMRLRSPLSIAVARQNKLVVEKLISLGADVTNALHWAIEDGQEEMVHLICTLANVDIRKKYISPNKSDKNKETSLKDLAENHPKASYKRLLDCHDAISSFSDAVLNWNSKTSQGSMFAAFTRAYEIDKTYVLSHLQSIVRNINKPGADTKQLYLLDALRMLHFISTFPDKEDAAMFSKLDEMMRFVHSYDFSVERGTVRMFNTPLDLFRYMKTFPQYKEVGIPAVVEEKAAPVVSASNAAAVSSTLAVLKRNSPIHNGNGASPLNGRSQVFNFASSPAEATASTRTPLVVDKSSSSSEAEAIAVITTPAVDIPNAPEAPSVGVEEHELNGVTASNEPPVGLRA